MQIITAAQCRAARALLNWSQPELAERCGIHVQTISNFEKESSTPSKTTLGKITTVLETAGLELLEDDGLKRKQEVLQKYTGSDGFKLFMTDIYETVKQTGGDICLLNASPALWTKWLSDEWYYDVHAPRMRELNNFNFRVTTPMGNYKFLGKGFAEYRWLPDKIWNENSFYSYADKIGFFNFDNNELEILVLKQKKFAETFRFLFDLVWDQYTIIPDSSDHKPA